MTVANNEQFKKYERPAIEDLQAHEMATSDLLKAHSELGRLTMQQLGLAPQVWKRYEGQLMSFSATDVRVRRPFDYDLVYQGRMERVLTYSEWQYIEESETAARGELPFGRYLVLSAHDDGVLCEPASAPTIIREQYKISYGHFDFAQPDEPAPPALVVVKDQD